MRFAGKTALVTGAATGIGRAAAIRFAQEGAKVVIVDIHAEKLAAVKKEIEVYTDEVLEQICDVSNEAEVYETVEKAKQHFGKIDILINNAAVWRNCASFIELPTEEWRRYININVMGTVYFMKAILPDMIEYKYGKIINIASVAGVYGKASMVHYSATKGAVISMTKAAAKEVAKLGICINAISPGSVSPAENPDMDFYEESNLPYMERTGTDNENANLICFLASDEASYITGQNIQIDGCRKLL